MRLVPTAIWLDLERTANGSDGVVVKDSDGDVVELRWPASAWTVLMTRLADLAGAIEAMPHIDHREGHPRTGVYLWGGYRVVVMSEDAFDNWMGKWVAERKALTGGDIAQSGGSKPIVKSNRWTEDDDKDLRSLVVAMLTDPCCADADSVLGDRLDPLRALVGLPLSEHGQLKSARVDWLPAHSSELRALYRQGKAPAEMLHEGRCYRGISPQARDCELGFVVELDHDVPPTG